MSKEDLKRTKIEWVRNPDGTPGYCWNPTTGCTNGCSYCYARRYATRFHGGDFTPKFHPERLEAPLRRKKPSRVFVDSMGDLFDPNVQQAWRNEIYNTMWMAVRHTFVVLTKQPQNILMQPPDLGKHFSNVWHLVSCEDEAAAAKRIPELLKLREHGWPVLGASFEPLLGRIGHRWIDGLDWVICGAQTGPGAKPPMQDWVSSIEFDCKVAGIPLFEKNNLGLADPIQQWPEVKA